MMKAHEHGANCHLSLSGQLPLLSFWSALVKEKRNPTPMVYAIRFIRFNGGMKKCRDREYKCKHFKMDEQQEGTGQREFV